MVKNLPAMQETPGLISGSGRSPGEGNGSPFRDSCLGNPIDRGSGWTTVHRVEKSQTRLCPGCRASLWCSWPRALWANSLLSPPSWKRYLCPDCLQPLRGKGWSRLGWFWSQRAPELGLALWRALEACLSSLLPSFIVGLPGLKKTPVNLRQTVGHSLLRATG